MQARPSRFRPNFSNTKLTRAALPVTNVSCCWQLITLYCTDKWQLLPSVEQKFIYVPVPFAKMAAPT
jgi:hypothetical protein